MGSGSSRLYSALAKTLSSSSSSAAAAAPQHRECAGQPEAAPLEPIDPQELLEECQVVLRRRPPRCQRDFVDLRQKAAGGPRPIRVMQWNILAQGAWGPPRRGPGGGNAAGEGVAWSCAPALRRPWGWQGKGRGAGYVRRR